MITIEIPCESHSSLGPGERYHAPLKRIYNKLKEEEPGLSNELTLSIAVNGMNMTANTEGLIPTLLVFGTVPKIALGNIEHLTRTQKQRFTAMESARKQIERFVAQLRLKIATKLRIKGMDIFNTSPGPLVLVYGEKMERTN